MSLGGSVANVNSDTSDHQESNLTNRLSPVNSIERSSIFKIIKKLQ